MTKSQEDRHNAEVTAVTTSRGGRMADADLSQLLEREVSGFDLQALRVASAAMAQEYNHDTVAQPLGRDLGRSTRELLLHGRHQLYKLICTPSADYREERASIKGLKTTILVVVSSNLAARFGVERTLATMVTTVVMSLPVKVGIKAWCEYYKDNALSRNEQKRLREE